jgi:hypothetical protein
MQKNFIHRVVYPENMERSKKGNIMRAHMKWLEENGVYELLEELLRL